MITTLASIRAELRSASDPEQAANLQRFFKTGPGEYGEGDRFLGLRVPFLRRLARAHRGLPVADALELLRSEWHEERMLGLLLLVDTFKRGDEAVRREIYEHYVANTAHINNWDLIDTSAEHIVGAHLGAERIEPLERLARSESVWERRIAILSTFHFIKKGEFEPTLKVVELLLRDPHDLIHKGVGWMLREIGERDRAVEDAFLRKHYRVMPRTMLRYAIEKYPEDVRQQYLNGQIK